MEKYLDFLRYSLSDSLPLPESAKDINWVDMMAWAKKQAIVGVIYNGIKRAGEEIPVPLNVLMDWVGHITQIEMMNRLVNKCCAELTRDIIKAEFDCCILKGQGNALMYPNPLYRTAGDIDIWMKPKGQPRNVKMEDVREEIIYYFRKKYKIEDTRYYHIEFHIGKVPVEAHFMPGIMNNPFYNKRLQRFYSDQQDEQWQHWVNLPDGEGRIPVPTFEFNVIFQLSHMMHHFFDEGIGLKQMIDYFYLLKQGDFKLVQLRQPELLNHLGLRNFAGAVMYVMQEVFGLEQNYLIVPADERRGKTLLNEIVKGGNFGQFSGLPQHSTGMKYFLKNWRSLKLVSEYPAEALSEPLFRTYHFFWRKKKV